MSHDSSVVLQIDSAVRVDDDDDGGVDYGAEDVVGRQIAQFPVHVVGGHLALAVVAVFRLLHLLLPILAAALARACSRSCAMVAWQTRSPF